MSDGWSDRQVVDALLKGDRKAVDIFFGEAYCAPILRTLSRRFRFDYQYEDFCQNFALHIMDREWLCLRKWEGRSALKPYLWQVAIHFCCQLYRKMQREPRTCALSDCEGGPAEEDMAQLNPLQIVENRDNLAALLRSIEKLPERGRLMVYMLIDQRRIPEIAEAFGLSLEAVRTALFRARNRLIEILREGGHHDAVRTALFRARNPLIENLREGGHHDA